MKESFLAKILQAQFVLSRTFGRFPVATLRAFTYSSGMGPTMEPPCCDLMAPPQVTEAVRVSKMEPNGQCHSDPKLEQLEAWLLSQNVQAEHDMRHSFAPGVYMREILMFKGTLLIGHEHKFQHFNIVLRGKALVMMDGRTQLIEAPCYFDSGAGVRKVLLILEDMSWTTVHANPDELRDLDVLHDYIFQKSPTFKKFEELMLLDEFKDHAEKFKPSITEVVT